MPSPFGGRAAPVAERVGSNSQNLVDAMGSKFAFGGPTGLPMGGNFIVKNVSDSGVWYRMKFGIDRFLSYGNVKLKLFLSWCKQVLS